MRSHYASSSLAFTSPHIPHDQCSILVSSPPWAQALQVPLQVRPVPPCPDLIQRTPFARFELPALDSFTWHAWSLDSRTRRSGRFRSVENEVDASGESARGVTSDWSGDWKIQGWSLKALVGLSESFCRVMVII